MLIITDYQKEIKILSTSIKIKLIIKLKITSNWVCFYNLLDNSEKKNIYNLSKVNFYLMIRIFSVWIENHTM